MENNKRKKVSDDQDNGVEHLLARARLRMQNSIATEYQQASSSHR